MNASKVCLYSEVIRCAPDDQRSTPLNVCDRADSPHSSSIDVGLSSSCATQRRGYTALSENRTALPRSLSMATATSIGSQSAKITEQARTKTAQSLALPCPSNVVRVCVAGTKYSVGKLKVQLQLMFGP